LDKATSLRLSAPQIRYLLLDKFGEPWSCDPNAYPIARAGGPNKRKLESFSAIQDDTEAYVAITKHLGLSAGSQLSDEQRLSVSREYKKLKMVDLQLLAEGYKFAIVTHTPGDAGPKSGLRVEGTIDRQGQISVLTKTPVVLTCPICLAGDARIATPSGSVAVKDLRPGMLVWTQDVQHRKIVVPVVRVASLAMLDGHPMMHLVMRDGRELWVSPGHPTIDGRTVGELQENDLYEGAAITSTVIAPYRESRTYDLLPAGNTGFYWANEIPLASTLQ
jgi:hypothetical protein